MRHGHSSSIILLIGSAFFIQLQGIHFPIALISPGAQEWASENETNTKRREIFDIPLISRINNMDSYQQDKDLKHFE